MKARFLALLLLVVVAGAAAVTTSAQAQGPQLIQLGCDTLTFNPPRVHVEFAVVNLSPIPVCSIHMIPRPSGPYPPCDLFDCSHPESTWTCQLNPAGGADWQALPGPTASNCVLPYDKLEGFDFVIDPPYCCYDVFFDGPNGEIFGQQIFCFQCESPTAARSSTWGHVKGIYR